MRAGRATRALAWVALAGGAVATAAGCGAHASAPSVATTCATKRSGDLRAVWLHASDGQQLYAVHGGSGDVGVVLVPESPSGNVCDWLPFAGVLERSGRRVLVVDYRGTGQSLLTPDLPHYAYRRDLAAAVSRLRRDGAHRVILAGASLGGAAAMAYGADLGVDGVISFSGEPELSEFHVDALHAVSRLRVPLLMLDAREDLYLPVGDARKLLRRAGSAHKRLVLFPAAWHGWDLVQSAPYAERARRIVLAWIRAFFGPPAA